MGVFTGLRRAGAAGAITILAAWMVVPLGEFAREVFVKADSSSPVSVVAIEVPEHERNACHHHPAGCPKDCFCPKTSVAGEPTAVSPSQGDLSVPILTQCTEGVAKQGAPFTALLFPFPPCEFSLLESASVLSPTAAHSPVDRSPDLPQKIPIA